MSNSFLFKEFVVFQKGASLKVGTDSMVLGAFINEQNALTALDIGTGTGVLALMVAQRHPGLKIMAIEIDQINIELAELNFKQSKFHKQISLLKADFFDFPFTTKFDLIFSNPPFFVDSLDSKDIRKSNSRHFKQNQLKTFLFKVTELLTENGIFFLIIPFEHANVWIEQMPNHLFVHEEIIVFGKPGKAKRIIVKCSLIKNELTKRFFTIRDNDGNYTDEYVELTKDFHGIKISSN